MKKKIYLAVTVLLLTLAGIYVAARMILWGGPVSFRSYVLLLGDLLCLLLLLFYVYLRVPIRLHRKIRDKWGTPGKWEWLEDIGIALWAVLCLIVTFAGIAWIWFENDIPSETRLTENLISVEEMEFPDRHWYSYWRPEGVLFRRETELAGEDYITYLTELMDKEENTHPEDAETVAKQAMEEQWLAEYYASETENAEDVQDPLEPYAQAVYDAVLHNRAFPSKSATMPKAISICSWENRSRRERPMHTRWSTIVPRRTENVRFSCCTGIRKRICPQRQHRSWSFMRSAVKICRSLRGIRPDGQW